jgi:predicted aspartyl protease
MEVKMNTHKITIDLPGREAEVSVMDEPNRFPHYCGSEEGMKKVAAILNRAMGRMEDIDREIPLTAKEVGEIQKITGDA